jgi:arylsulfatase A-like enzyme/thioredoxin-like negative regulator of GroEL
MTAIRPVRRAALLTVLTLASCARGPSPGDLAGWNVLLITIDTLRADHLGFNGYRGTETPNLDLLAEEGVVFVDAFASAPLTLPSHTTLLTGLYPPNHGVLDNGLYSLPSEVPTLAKILGEAGYRTAAVVGSYVLHGRFGLSPGFDMYDDRFRQPRVSAHQQRERPAEEVTEKALGWLAERDEDRPFFLWVHYFDPHLPYEPPGRFETRYKLRPYDGEIAYTDASLGPIFEALRSSGEWDRTLVVFCADHGEALDEGESTHGILLHPVTTRIPMILRAPGVLPAGTRVGGTVSAVDVAPTVLDLLGIEPPEELDGVSLLEVVLEGRAENRFAYSETRYPADIYGWSMLAGLRTDDWTWIRAPRPELYDRKADPLEETSLHESEAEVAAELDAKLELVLSGARNVSAAEQLSSEEVEALQALGYVFGKTRPQYTGKNPRDMIGVLEQIQFVRGDFNSGKLRKALEGAERVLEQDEGNPAARSLRARSLVGLGRHDEGLEELRQLYEMEVLRDPTGPKPGPVYAQALAQAGRTGEAEKILRELMAAEPDIEDHPFNLGVLFTDQKRHEQALELYELAYEANPDAIHIISNLALTLSHLARSDEDEERSLRLIDDAIRLAGTNDRPRFMRIEILENLGYPDRGLEEAKALLNRGGLQGVTRSELADAVARLEES